MTTTAPSPSPQELGPDARALHGEIGQFLGEIMVNGGVGETSLVSKKTAYGEVAVNGTVAVDGAYINSTGDQRWATEAVASVTKEDGTTHSAHLYTGGRNIAVVRSENPDGSVTRVRDTQKAAEIVALAQAKIRAAANLPE